MKVDLPQKVKIYPHKKTEKTFSSEFIYISLSCNTKVIFILVPSFGGVIAS